MKCRDCGDRFEDLHDIWQHRLSHALELFCGDDQTYLTLEDARRMATDEGLQITIDGRIARTLGEVFASVWWSDRGDRYVWAHTNVPKNWRPDHVTDELCYFGGLEND